MATPTSAHAAYPQQRSGGWYYTIVGVLFIIAAIAGFAPSLIDTSQRRAPLNALVALHGILGAAWLVLFTAQAWLIRTRRIVWHRRLGVMSVDLAIVFVVVGYMGIVDYARRGYDLSGDLDVKGDLLGAFVFPLGDLASFTTLLAAGCGIAAGPSCTSVSCCWPRSAG